MIKRLSACLLLAVLLGSALLVYLLLRSPAGATRESPPESPQPAATANPTPAAPSSPAVPLPSTASTPEAPSAPTPPANTPNPSAAAAPAVPIPVSPEGQPTDLPPATVLENMRTTIRLFGSMFGGNPVGTNLEITRALAGDNPKHINFLKPDGNRVNGQGELIDSWGTPYFFHQLSGTEMEIRSAGPDRKMWTPDDLVIK